MDTAGRILATRYRLLDRIGAGGMATVWRARDLRLERDVAIKILRPQFAEDADFVARFETEARHAASVSHPNVATVFDTGVDGDLRFIVMELVDGPSVADILRARGPLPPGQAVDVAAAAARALAAAHRRGLVHRDVKPANILVGRDGRVRLADFGIARALTTSRITAPGTVLGSIPYLSPEQARGEEASAAGDVFSLGVVLYEMLTGRLPWAVDGPAAMATVRTTAPPIPLAEARRDLPRGLQRIVERALRIDPAARYPSARALAESLETWARRHARELPDEPDLAETATLVAAAPFAGAGGRDDDLVAPMKAGLAVAGAAFARSNPEASGGGPIEPDAPPIVTPRVAARTRRRPLATGRTGRQPADDRRAAAVLLAALAPIAALGVLLIAGAFRLPGSDAIGGPGATGDLAVADEQTRRPSFTRTPMPEPTPEPTPTQTPEPTATPAPTTRPTAQPAPEPTPRVTPKPRATATPAPARASGPARAVQRFYDAVESHDWDTAIALWSPSMRERYPPQEWLIDRFKRTTRIDVTRLATRSVDSDAGTANVAVRLVEYRTVEPSPRSFTGSWDLVRIDGHWKLDQPHF